MNSNLLTIQQRSANIIKSFENDPSHGGKLVQKIITDKHGHKETKWVKASSKSEKSKEAQWWDEYKKYKLNAYPFGIPESEVKINISGDINSHWVMQWKDPKSGAMKSAYTQEFLQRNANAKWERIQNVSSENISEIKRKSIKLISSGKTESEKGAAAVIAIIAETGLRRGDKLKFQITGNRGVSTLAPENVTIKGNKVTFNFTGKSYQENTATLTNATIAKYLTDLKEKRNGERFLFETNDAAIDRVFDAVGGKGLELKDLRTYVATDIAKDVLFTDKSEPPPLPANLSITKQKQLIKAKLTKCYDIVSQKLNNTPAMAKNAYIHPNVVTKWIEMLGVSFEIKKGNVSNISLDDISNSFEIKSIGKIDPDSEEMCDVFIDVLQNYD